MTSPSHDLLIIGAGPSGLTAGLYGCRSGLDVLILGGNHLGGQVMRHHWVENYPGFPGGVTGAELMARWLKQVMDETGSMPLPESVTGVDFSGTVKRVYTAEGAHNAKAVIVATGSRPRVLGVSGESDYQGKGVFYCATCDAPLMRTMSSRRAAVIGGGDTAFHTALALLPHSESVTVITRGTGPRAKPVLVDRLLEETMAGVLPRRSVLAVTGEDRVTGLILENTDTGEKEAFPVDAVFVGIGQSPVTDFLRRAVELDELGFIVTDPSLGTSADGVFAAGDVRATPVRQILTAAADGALAAHSAAEYLRARGG